MTYNREPIYIDDIKSITYCNGKISCVRFDKQEITIRRYNSCDKVLALNLPSNQLVNCSISKYHRR